MCRRRLALAPNNDKGRRSGRDDEKITGDFLGLSCRKPDVSIELMDVVSSAAVDWALTHVKRFGDTDIFPVPFEFGAV